MKHYFLALVCVGDDQLEQEAIEYALYQGWFKPQYHFAADQAALRRQLPILVEQFQQVAQANAEANQPMQQFLDGINTCTVRQEVRA